MLSLIAVLLVNTSCNDDFLNKKPLDQYSSEAVWNDPALIETFVNDIYFSIPHGFSNMMMASMVDETMYNADFGSSNVTKSLITPSDYSIFDENFWSANRQKAMNWRNIYRYIRACNMFFENIEKTPFEDEAFRDRMKGEVHFLRAYLYLNLVSMYGGVPLITEAYTLDDDFLVARNSIEECFDFIEAECDLAASLLPLEHADNHKGRATQGGALALKSRALLYAASDFYHDPSWAGGYASPELISFAGANRAALWQKAKDAAKAVMDLGIYDLYKKDPAPGEDPAKNYGDIFLQKETIEDIHVQFFIPNLDFGWDGYNPGLYNNPNGYHGWGSNTPIGQHVDAYEMADGSKFDWNDPAHKANPYQNRDPRFYASILYEGAKWRQRPADVVASDPAGIIQVGYWEKFDPNNPATPILIPGLDTRNSPIEDWNGTYTGYYMKKFIDPGIDAQYFKQDLPWRYIRYAEIVLNYAEACLGLGQEPEARTYINMIRKRAGMPEVTESGSALIEKYRNERRIELAFEDHRFFDVRRWAIADEAYGSNAVGVKPLYELNADNSMNLTTPSYEIVMAQDRAWNPRFYLMPIKLDEMNRNKLLVQNPLY